MGVTHSQVSFDICTWSKKLQLGLDLSLFKKYFWAAVTGIPQIGVASPAVISRDIFVVMRDTFSSKILNLLGSFFDFLTQQG